MLPINHNAMCPRSEAACTPTLQQTAYDGIPRGFLSIGLVPMKQSGRKKNGTPAVIRGVKRGRGAARLTAKLDIIRLG